MPMVGTTGNLPFNASESFCHDEHILNVTMFFKLYSYSWGCLQAQLKGSELAVEATLK